MSTCVHLSTSILVYGESVEIAIKKLIFLKPLLSKNIKFYNVHHGVEEKIYEFKNENLRNQSKVIGRRKYNITYDAFVIGYIGQFIERKGIIQLSIIMNNLLSSNKKIYFFSLGTGPLNCEILKLKKRYNERVVILNKCDDSDLKLIYSVIDLMIVPSVRDDWCTITNECFLSRTPILASIYAYSTRDLVIDGITGWTFDPILIDEFQIIIDRIILNKKSFSKISENAYSFIKYHWSEKISTAAWTNCFKLYI